MRLEAVDINFIWTDLIVEELLRNNVTCFVISPGSRSAPLTCAIARTKGAESVVHFDERGSAFYAVGYARASGRPAVLVCTSGTATANYVPAVVEASKDQLPLIILTADRPPELRHTGANQTIDQVGLYGKYIRWEVDLPCPDTKIAPEFVLTTVDQAVYRSRRSPSGPVHLNCMFREPLAPVGEVKNFRPYLSSVADWLEAQTVYTEYAMPEVQCGEVVLENLALTAGNWTAPLLVVGRLSTEAERKAVSLLVEKTGWPTLPDICSGLRLGSLWDNIFPYYDLILRSEHATARLQPEVVIHIGGQVTSKRLQRFISNCKPETYMRITDNPARLDENHIVTTHFESGVVSFCHDFLSLATESKEGKQKEFWAGASELTEEVLEASNNPGPTLSEVAIARLVTQNININGALFLGNSRPIRDFDGFSDTKGAAVPVAANRGASGIDGTIASAVGFAAGLKHTVTLITGDLAMLHDLNSLALLKEADYPLVIVVINNDGGGIFSFLPITECGDIFERYFGTPHGLRFSEAAKMFEFDYCIPRNNDEFVLDYRDAQENRGSTIIEVVCNRESSLAEHRAIEKSVIDILKSI